MKILVLGANGSMGRKYCAILRHLKEDVIECDIEADGVAGFVGGKFALPDGFDRAIIATPTRLHSNHILRLVPAGRPILCEKPIAKNPAHVSTLADYCRSAGVDCRMVNNWQYALYRPLMEAGEVAVMGEMELEYKYYDTGKDGFWWDLIQLVYMAGRLKWDRASPIWEASVNGHPITLRDIHQSYVSMVSDWLYSEHNRLWTLDDALKATKKVEAVSGFPTPEVGEIDLRGLA